MKYSREPFRYVLYWIAAWPGISISYLIQNRYRDLLRVSREWRDLKLRIRAGHAHDRVTDFVPGALAIFCPACPQLGINIPPEDQWKDDEV